LAMALTLMEQHPPPRQAFQGFPPATGSLSTRIGGCKAPQQLQAAAGQPGATGRVNVNNNNRALLTYIGVAERLLRMHRSAAARFRELVCAPQQQQRERRKDAVKGKRHLGQHCSGASSSSASSSLSAQMRCGVDPEAALPPSAGLTNTHVNNSRS
ncbi:hypothetical protein GOODEAATRI_021087, partial [Goodea atripinnis]